MTRSTTPKIITPSGKIICVGKVKRNKTPSRIVVMGTANVSMELTTVAGAYSSAVYNALTYMNNTAPTTSAHSACDEDEGTSPPISPEAATQPIKINDPKNIRAHATMDAGTFSNTRLAIIFSTAHKIVA